MRRKLTITTSRIFIDDAEWQDYLEAMIESSIFPPKILTNLVKLEIGQQMSDKSHLRPDEIVETIFKLEAA